MAKGSLYSKLLHFVLVILAILLGASGFAQNKLEVNGRLKIEDGDLSNSRVVVFKNGVKERTISTDLAKFNIQMDLDATYVLSFEKNGYVSKKLSFNTKTPADAAAKQFLPFDFAVSLFKQYDDVNLVVFNQPVGMIRYEAGVGDFDYDTDYTKSIQSQLQAALEEIEEKKKEVEEAAKNDAEKAKQLAKEEEKKKKEEAANAKAEAARLEAERIAQEKADARAAKEEADRLAQLEKDEKAKLEAERKQAELAAEAERNAKRAPVTEEAVKPVAPPVAAKVKPKSKPKPKPQPAPVIVNTTTASAMKGSESRRSIEAISGSESSRMAAAKANSGVEQRVYKEPEIPNIVRNEDLVIETNKVIKTITFERTGASTEFRKVTHKWGGTFYFKNGIACTQEIFDRETATDHQDQIAGATPSR